MAMGLKNKILILSLIIFIIVCIFVLGVFFAPIFFSQFVSVRGAEEMKLDCRREAMKEIADFFRKINYDFSVLSVETLKKEVPIIKKIEKIDTNFYLLHVKKYLFLLGNHRTAEPENNMFLGFFLCDALPKGYFSGNKKSSRRFLYSGEVLFDRSSLDKEFYGFTLWYTSNFPPVPGCFYDRDHTKNIQAIKYSEAAKKRFKLYYPELFDELEKLSWVVLVK